MPPDKRHSIVTVVALATVCCLSLVMVIGAVAWMSESQATCLEVSVSNLLGEQQSARPSVAAVTLSSTVTTQTRPTQTPTPIVILEMSATPATSLPPATSPVLSAIPATATPAQPTATPAASLSPLVEQATQPPIYDGSPLPEWPATRLVIPALALDAPVTVCPIVGETWQTDHLGTDLVGHLAGTASPGDPSNVVLAGHVTVAHDVYGPFAGLGMLQPGDAIVVYAGDTPYTYIMDYRQLVDRTDVHVAHPTDTGQVTLITCSNWSDEMGAYQERLIVVGHLVDETERQD